jgi:hypothetical protein
MSSVSDSPLYHGQQIAIRQPWEGRHEMIAGAARSDAVLIHASLTSCSDAGLTDAWLT